MKGKALRKYTIMFVVCFLLLIGIVNAEKALVVDYNTTRTFIGPHNNLTCSGDLHYFKISGSEASGYEVSYKYDLAEGKTEKVTCSYDDGKGLVEEDFYFQTHVRTEISYEVFLNNYEPSETSFNVDGVLWGTSERVKITSFELGDAKGYYTADCKVGGNKCKFKLTNNYPSENLSVPHNILKYDIAGFHFTADITVKMVDNMGIRAYTSKKGTCDFNKSEWDVKGGNWSTATYSYYKSKSSQATLPSCKPKTDYPLLEFAGWAKSENTDDVATQYLNKCVSKVAVGAGGGVYSSTTSVMLFDCYRTTNGATLYTSDFTINDSSWTEFKKYSYFKKGDQIVLPDVKEKELGSRKFEGWRDTETNKVYAPGETVTATGQSFTAKYTSTIVTYDKNKTIYLGKTSVLKPYGVTVTSCVSANTDMVSINGSGECSLYGKAETKGTPVDVIVYGENDYEQKYRIYVVNPYGGEKTNLDGTFEINLTPNSLAGVTNRATLDGYTTDTCNSFQFTADDRGPNTGGGNLNQYKFNGTCTGSNSTYIGYCLDAGRSAPTSSSTKYSRTLDVSSDSDYAKLINYMASKRYFTNSTTNVIVVNTLLRVIGYIDGITVASEYNVQDKDHAAFYDYYVDLAKIITDENGNPVLNDKGDFAENVVEAFANRLVSDTEKSGVSGADTGAIYNRTKDVLGNYKTSKTRGKSFEREITKTEYFTDENCTTLYDGEGDIYYVRHTGVIKTSFGELELEKTLKGGSVVNGVQLIYDKSSLTLKETESNEEDNASYNVYEYVIVLKVDIKSLKVPKTEKEQTEMSTVFSFKGKITNADGTVADNAVTDVFIAEASGSAATQGYQRMLMFSINTIRIYVYFSPALGSGYCKMVDELNPDKCLSSANCDLEANTALTASGFNPTLFSSSGCCNLLTDEDKYAYIIDNVCSNKCVSTTLVSVCDYRDTFTGNENDIYDVNEGQDREGNYKLGGKAACIVNTEDLSRTVSYYNKKEGLNSLNETPYLNKEDEAGNSLMVDVYNKNRYCRVSCAENWQITMESFGNYLGTNGVAAGSYFQLTEDNMFVSGKRTCFTTFMNYGTNTNDQTEIKGSDTGFTADVSEASDRYVDAYNKYTDLSHVYSDLACDSTHNDYAWDNYCEYNAIKQSFNLFCVSSTVKYYCYNESDVNLATGAAPSKDNETSSFACKTAKKETSWTGWKDTKDEAVEAAKQSVADYNSKYTEVTFDNANSAAFWAKQNGSTAIYDSYKYEDSCENSTNPDCESKYRAKAYYYYTYTSLSYNYCNSYTSQRDDWGVCMIYYLTTNSKFDDRLPYGEGPFAEGATDSHPGSYVKYIQDTKDGYLSSALANTSGSIKTKSVLEGYATITANNRTAAPGKVLSDLRTGNFNPDDLELGYAYYTDAAARKVIANDNDGSDQILAYGTGDQDRVGIQNQSTNSYMYGGGNIKTGYARLASNSTEAANLCKRPAEITLTLSNGETNSYQGAENIYLSYSDYFTNKSLYLTSQYEVAVTDPLTGETTYEPNESYRGSTDRADSELGAGIREKLLEHSGIGSDNTRGPSLERYVDNMNTARGDIVRFTQDMYDCQHFELYNTTDDEDSAYKNNSLSSAFLMGSPRSFVKVNTAFKPDISYSYDEQEYMTILGSENVMIKFQALNSKYYCNYDISRRLEVGSATLDCYNQATNVKKPLNTGKTYYSKYLNNNETELSQARNYTETIHYDTKGKYWNNNSKTALSYAANVDKDGLSADDTGTIYKVRKYTCGNTGEDCNIGEKVVDNTYFKRTLFCTLGQKMGIGYVSGTGSKGDSFSYSYTIRDTGAYWTDGECYVVEVQYVRANYIKSSIENSSFYVNKGNWYLKDNDIKSHGDNLEEALIKAGFTTTTEEKYLWTKIGSYNVFPIKMTTPRDIYQYTYTFANIGSKADGELGRIMGSPTALISLNRRTCFYEVFEDICLCCGNPLTAHTGEVTSTHEYVEANGWDYAMSSQDPSKASTNATLGFWPSTISLSDMEPGGENGVKLATNWSDSSVVFYNGEVYSTNKGAELLGAIESKGDNAYYDEPEYSYTLTPSKLAEIRDYNDIYGYGVNYDKLVAVGKFAMTPFDDKLVECEDDTSGCQWEVDGNSSFKINGTIHYDYDEIINFQHYASKFLDSEILGGNKGIIDVSENYKLNEACYILGGEDVELEYDDIRTLVKDEKCRWVDYVQPSTSTKGTKKIIRLAFK